jgi:cytochrome c
MKRSEFELNKIAGAVLLAGLIGMVAGKATEYLYEGGPAHPGPAHTEAQRGYKIEGAEEATAANAPAKPQGAPNIDAFYATADLAKGADYFGKKCAVCHTKDKGGANMVGPNLWGVIGKQIASHEGFGYSKALTAKNTESWNFENMNQWQFAPRKWAPGTIMAYAGTQKDQDRANLIAYLNSLSDSPAKLPVAAPAPAEDAAAVEAPAAAEKATP